MNTQFEKWEKGGAFYIFKNKDKGYIEYWNYNKWCELNNDDDIRDMYYLIQYRNKRLKESGNPCFGTDSITVKVVDDKYLSLNFPYYLRLHEYHDFMNNRDLKSKCKSIIFPYYLKPNEGLEFMNGKIKCQWEYGDVIRIDVKPEKKRWFDFFFNLFK